MVIKCDKNFAGIKKIIVICAPITGEDDFNRNIMY
jgi:hypothetical protein